MQEIHDYAFDGQHYLPWTLRPTPRDPIINKSEVQTNWVIDCENQKEPLWSLKTPSYLSYGLVSSCMQGSIRGARVLESI
jgi:hypothetical protein